MDSIIRRIIKCSCEAEFLEDDWYEVHAKGLTLNKSNMFEWTCPKCKQKQFEVILGLKKLKTCKIVNDEKSIKFLLHKIKEKENSIDLKIETSLGYISWIKEINWLVSNTSFIEHSNKNCISIYIEDDLKVLKGYIQKISLSYSAAIKEGNPMKCFANMTVVF